MPLVFATPIAPPAGPFLEASGPQLSEKERRLACLYNLQQLNRSDIKPCGRNGPVPFDAVRLLTQHGIDPRQVRFELREPFDALFEVRFFYRNKHSGQARLQHDTYHGGIKIAPWLKPQLQGRAVGSAMYLAVARYLWLKRGELLSSDPHQLTPDAEAVWRRLVDHRQAFSMRNGGCIIYQVRPSTVSCAQAARLFDFMLRTERYRLERKC